MSDFPEPTDASIRIGSPEDFKEARISETTFFWYGRNVLIISLQYKANL